MSSSSNFDSLTERSESPWACMDPQKTRRRCCFEPHHFAESRGSLIEVGVLSWDNLPHLIASDLSKSRREWTQFQVEEKEVGIEIEQIIFEEIREELLVDVLDSL